MGARIASATTRPTWRTPTSGNLLYVGESNSGGGVGGDLVIRRAEMLGEIMR
jgi:hypothetical protein